jgi:hypothetical protein
MKNEKKNKFDKFVFGEIKVNIFGKYKIKIFSGR